MKKLIAALFLIGLSVAPASALLKNGASQVICAQLNSLTDGSAVTGGSTDVYVTGDVTAQTLGAGSVSHKGGGLWCYVPAQAETNYDHVAFTFANTAAIPTSVQTYTSQAGIVWPVMEGGVYVPTIVQDKALRIVAKDSLTAPFDLGADYSGWAITFGVKKSYNDTDYTIGPITGTWTDATTGKGSVSLSISDTTIKAGNYVGQLLLTKTGERTTAVLFTVEIIPTVIP